jgi:hypothetical protein
MPDTDASRYDPSFYSPAEAEAELGIDSGGMSTLDALRAAVAAEAAAIAEAELADPVVLYSPGEHIRLVCDRNLNAEQIKKARLAAIPRSARRQPMSAAAESKLQESIFFARLIAGQTREIWLKNGEEKYTQVVTEGREPADFTDPRLLLSFGATEGWYAVQQIFVKDNHLFVAAQQLLDGCGWGDPDDAGDPL